MDGDPSWENRNTRFLKPLHIDEILKIRFTISDKKELDDEFGMIAVDFEGKKQNGDLVVVAKKNLYRIRKEPPK
jgi:acyl dehydratase